MQFLPGYRKPSGGGRCCVPTCGSLRRKTDNISFHTVPGRTSYQTIRRKNSFGHIEFVSKRAEWLRILQVEDLKKELLVCSLHFRKEDYTYPDANRSSRFLKKSAVPQSPTSRFCNLSNENINEEYVDELENFISEEHLKTKHVTESNELLLDDEDLYFRNVEDISLEVSSYIDMFNSSVDATANVNVGLGDNTTSSEEKSVQVATDQLPITFCSFIKTEKDLKIMCNINSLNVLNELVDLMDDFYPLKQKRSLTTRECILLAMTKLKLDIPFSVLGVLMNSICEVTVRNLFYDTLKKLSTILQSVLSRVSKEEIERNMPTCFSNFMETTSVIDCTEVHVQKPKCLKWRIKLYSHYKGDLTVKFLVEVTPGGLIVNVSKSFGGRASDKCIFQHSNILQNLQSGRDAVMVDKGFLIDDECQNKRIKLIRPPFAKSHQQMSEEDATLNREIACARVHVERMNARIKQFKILTNKIPWHLMRYIDDIFLVCCGLANLGSPILADEKFIK